MNYTSRKIYFVLSFSGTALSTLIKVYTKDEFCHISVALDENLNEMYSFGRIKPYNPFIGGFVKESITNGTFKRFHNTKAEIYSLDVTEYQYKKIKRIIKKMNSLKSNYKFNTIGLFAVGLHLKYRKNNYFYCAEFVKYLVDEANINLNLPELVKPMHFKYVNNLTLEYRGKLKNYC